MQRGRYSRKSLDELEIVSGEYYENPYSELIRRRDGVSDSGNLVRLCPDSV